jgi:hypothetical protein
MKKIALVLFLVWSLPIVVLSGSEINSSTSVLYGGIDNGWYTATVKYMNYKTYTNSTYTLNVKVEYNSVVTIDFGNGGSIHTGYNNEGYIYSGGTLSFNRDYSSNTITSASTRVTMYEEGGNIRTFDIKIE